MAKLELLVSIDLFRNETVEKTQIQSYLVRYFKYMNCLKLAARAARQNVREAGTLDDLDFLAE